MSQPPSALAYDAVIATEDGQRPDGTSYAVGDEITPAYVPVEGVWLEDETITDPATLKIEKEQVSFGEIKAPCKTFDGLKGDSDANPDMVFNEVAAEEAYTAKITTAETAYADIEGGIDLGTVEY